MKVQCPHCLKVFTGRNADVKLRGHIGGKHSRSDRPATKVKAQDAEEKPRKKRKWTRRKPISTAVAVNFCPQCGCNLHAVAMGIAMAGRGGSNGQ